MEHQYKYVAMTDKAGNEILGKNGKPIITREYQYTRADGSKVVIQDHSAGHTYNDANGVGDQAAHLNLRPFDDTRNGKVPGTKEHYPFKEKK